MDGLARFLLLTLLLVTILFLSFTLLYDTDCSAQFPFLHLMDCYYIQNPIRYTHLAHYHMGQAEVCTYYTPSPTFQYFPWSSEHFYNCGLCYY